MKRFVGSLAFVGAIFLGFAVFINTFEYKQKRSTASLKNNYDLTCLSGEQLSKAIVSRIVLGIKGVRKDGYLGISIGHFVYSESKDAQAACAQGQNRAISSSFSLVSKKMACEVYPKINLRFTADGESASGDKREMEVEAPCTVAADISQTETAWVPWKQLSLETPFEGISEYSKPSKVTIKTHNVTDKWPEKWILNRIQMEGEGGLITIDSDQIKTVAGHPIIFEFN